MICNPCARESTKIIGGQEFLKDCSDCLVEKMIGNGILDVSTGKKFCNCFLNKHDQNKKVQVEPLSPELEEMIETYKKNLGQNIGFVVNEGVDRFWYDEPDELVEVHKWVVKKLKGLGVDCCN